MGLLGGGPGEVQTEPDGDSKGTATRVRPECLAMPKKIEISIQKQLESQDPLLFPEAALAAFLSREKGAIEFLHREQPDQALRTPWSHQKQLNLHQGQL